MEHNHPEVVLADLRGKFELVLEDYAALYAELQALRREAREQHELTTFLLRAVAADLAAHRADAGAHPDACRKGARRPDGRPARLTPCHSRS